MLDKRGTACLYIMLIEKWRSSSLKRISVDNLVGGEIVAKEIATNHGLVIIPVGSKIKKEYIRKLKELHIDWIFIEEMKEQKIDNLVQGTVETQVEKKILEECVGQIKNTIERYTCCASSELTGVVDVANHIIQEILEKPNVMYNVSTIREKNHSTYTHSVNVSTLAVLIALKLKLPQKKIQEIAVGSLLHDLGISYLPFDYEKVNIDECDENQLAEIRKHVLTGYTMVKDEDWLSNTAKEIILSHHERDDGSGYPMHLTSDRISIETKIVAICDELDRAVYSDHRLKYKVHHVIDNIMSKAGVLFDFRIVNAFVEVVAVYPIGTYVLLNTEEIGIVISQNYRMPTRPIVQVLGIKELDLSKKGRIVDLSQELTTYIRDTIEE